MEKELNKALKEILKEHCVTDVKVINDSNPNVNCYAVIFCKSYDNECAVQKTEKEIVDEKIAKAMEEEERRHYASRYGIPYQNGESNHAKGEERKEA